MLNDRHGRFLLYALVIDFECSLRPSARSMRVEPAQEEEEERHGKVQRQRRGANGKDGHGSSGGNREDFQRDG